MKIVVKRTCYSSWGFIRVCRFGGIHQEDDVTKVATFDCVEDANAFLLKHHQNLTLFSYFELEDGKLTEISGQPNTYII